MKSKVLRKYNQLFKIAIPIAFENLINNIVNVIDVFMVGKNIPTLGLGVAAVSALGVANQVFFVYIVALFGLLSGSSVLSAQYFGNKQIEKVKQIGTLILVISTIIGILFLILIKYNMNFITAFYTNDTKTAKLIVDYLSISLIAFPLVGLQFPLIMQLRVVNKPKYTVYANLLALFINIFLNYVLIFGNFGIPALGVKGAAIATVIARVFALIFLVVIIYVKKCPVYGSIKLLFKIKLEVIIKFIRLSIPMFFHEILWVLAITTRAGIIGQLGTNDFASAQITLTISGLLFAFYSGIVNGTGVLVGNRLGANEFNRAIDEVKRAFRLVIFLGILFFIILNLGTNTMLNIMGTNKEIYPIVKKLILIESISITAKGLNFLYTSGILRAGGDIIYAVLIDIIPVWINVLIIYILWNTIGLSVYLVFILILMDESFKIFIGHYRYKTGKWLNNLVENI